MNPLLQGQHTRELGILSTGIKLCPSTEGKGWKGKVLGCAGSKSPTQIPTLWKRLPEEGVLIPGLTWALALLQRGIFGIKWKFQQVLHGRSRSLLRSTHRNSFQEESSNDWSWTERAGVAPGHEGQQEWEGIQSPFPGQLTQCLP